MAKLKSARRVLVTGAGGFIGSHLVEALVAQGCNVRALVRYNSGGSWNHLDGVPESTKKQIEVVSGDIQDPFFCEQAVGDSEYVFHLAALIGIPYSYKAPASYVDVNIKGTINLLQACLKGGRAKFIHTSTSETYGTALYVPIDEKHPLQGQSPYSASKIGADKMVESYGLSFNMPVTTVRPFNTYGPRQSARAIIPTVICQLASGMNEIRLGSLTPVRDLNFVADTVSGFMAAAESDASLNQAIHFGTGKGITVGDLAQKIMELMGKKAMILTSEERMRPENSEVMQLICDPSKAKQLLGWAPKHTLDEGLKRTIDYVIANVDKYRPNTYAV